MSEIKLNIDESAGQTKIQQLVHSITEAISNGKLKAGEVLPSVNQLSSESGFSRDTVFKAYNILKKRNIIESAPQKGYYVTGESFKVFMLLDDFSAFKEQLYQSFRQNLPENYAVDLLFHHYNPGVFRQLVENSLGRYSMYIVMNISHQNIDPVLKKIDVNKLLILGMGNPVDSRINFLLQDFGQSVQQCLEESLDRLKKYDEMILVYEEKSTAHPADTVPAVREFCKKHQLGFRNSRQFNEAEVKKGQVWFVIRDTDLVQVIKACVAKKLVPGEDVGIISYNDTPMKEIVEGGVTVISTDFKKMGEMAADFVKNKQKLAEILSTKLIVRKSL